MIKSFAVQNYKALRDISLELTQIHALIGPNDSGKTSVLNALAALSRSTELPLERAFDGAWDGRELVWHDDAAGIIAFSVVLQQPSQECRYFLSCRFPQVGRNVVVHRESITFNSELDCGTRDHDISKVGQICGRNAGGAESMIAACRTVHDLLAGVHYYRWNPRMLALPVAADSTRRYRMKPDGFGLALLLDDILGADRELFSRLEQRFCSIFPEIRSIKLVRQPAFRSPEDEREQVSRIQQADGKGIYFEHISSKQIVPAAQSSDGVLLVLAYLAVLFSPEPPRLLLVEEPENGIHPRRLREVMKILRDLVTGQSRTQVVFTTHSPHLLDLLEKEEVTLCTKDESGAVTLTRMADSPSVREQLSIFTLGEIWTAEGDEDLAKSPVASGT